MASGGPKHPARANERIQIRCSMVTSIPGGGPRSSPVGVRDRSLDIALEEQVAISVEHVAPAPMQSVAAQPARNLEHFDRSGERCVRRYLQPIQREEPLLPRDE